MSSFSVSAFTTWHITCNGITKLNMIWCTRPSCSSACNNENLGGKTLEWGYRPRYCNSSAHEQRVCAGIIHGILIWQNHHKARKLWFFLRFTRLSVPSKWTWLSVSHLYYQKTCVHLKCSAFNNEATSKWHLFGVFQGFSWTAVV